MPPVVHREEVAVAPVVARKEGDAFVDAALHLVGVDDGVDRPHVVGIGVDRRETRVSAFAVVAGLFQAEGLHPAHERGVRMRRVEFGQGRPGRSRRFPASPRKKSSW